MHQNRASPLASDFAADSGIAENSTMLGAAATFQFSESDGSLNGPDLFTELPFL